MKLQWALLLCIAGYVAAYAQGTVIFNNSPSVVPGEVAAIQVRVWEAVAGDYHIAVVGGFKYFSSAMFTVTTGGAGSPPSLPANLVGLTSFSLIPEPTSPCCLRLA